MKVIWPNNIGKHCLRYSNQIPVCVYVFSFYRKSYCPRKVLLDFQTEVIQTGKNIWSHVKLKYRDSFMQSTDFHPEVCSTVKYVFIE